MDFVFYSSQIPYCFELRKTNPIGLLHSLYERVIALTYSNGRKVSRHFRSERGEQEHFGERGIPRN